MHIPPIWSILPGALTSVQDTLQAPDSPLPPSISALDWEEYCADCADEELSAQFDPVSGLLVQPIRGVIMRGATPEMEAFCGCFDLLRIDQTCAYAATAPGVRGLVFAIDSPGGYTSGMSTTLSALAALRAARPQLPLSTYTSGTCCSLAYIIAAAAGPIHPTSGATLGSIGVMAVTTDDSAAYRLAGIERRLLTDGLYKGLGTPGIPWSPDWYAHIQTHIDATSLDIRTRLSAQRPRLTLADMQGQTWDAAAAPAALHDGLVPGTLSDYLLALTPPL